MNAVIEAEVYEVHPSGVALDIACGQAHLEPDLNIKPDSAPARLGSAVHEALAFMLQGSLDPDLNKIAFDYNVDHEELSKLYYYGRKAWRDQLSQYFGTEYEVEKTLTCKLTPNIKIVGTLDLHMISPAEARILDWKSGWLTDSGKYLYQMLLYAYLCFKNYDLRKITVFIPWLRDYNFEIIKFEFVSDDEVLIEHEGKTAIFDIAEFKEELTAIYFDPDQPYQPGNHCGFCRRYYECPALTQMVKTDMDMIMDEEFDSFVANPQNIGAFHDRLGLVKRAIEGATLRERLFLGKAGAIEIPGWGRLELSQRAKTKIDTLKAFPVVQERLTDAEFAPALEFKIGKLKKAVNDKAERGQKKQAQEELVAALDEAGAISKAPFTVISKTKGNKDE